MMTAEQAKRQSIVRHWQSIENAINDAANGGIANAKRR